MGITAQDKAIAAEAINRHPDLSPSAKAVGIELLNNTDRADGRAWPSEAGMAVALNYSVRQVRRGKAELKAAGLLTWVRRGTSWKGRTPLYTLVWDALLKLAAVIRAKVTAARDAARHRIKAALPTSRASASTTISKATNNGPLLSVDRTSLSAYLTQSLNRSSGKGFWKAPGTPQGQVLTDQQLDARASARLYTALQQLGADIMAQFIARPDADVLQAKAIKAERYQQGSGIAVLRDLIQHGATA